MGFTEVTFLFIFLPASILIYLIVDRFHRIWLNNLVLIVVSLVFYAWASLDTLLFFAVFAVAVYLLGQLAFYCRKTDGDRPRKGLFLTAALLPVAVLVYFKLGTILAEGVHNLTGFQIPIRSVIVPVGISFVVFEAVSYIVDIYRGLAGTGTFIEYLTFLSLFPKLVSGPIVLWRDFQPQISSRRIDLLMVSEGIDRIIIGFAKKAILADSFGAQISLIRTSMDSSGTDTPTVWILAILYFFEIYYDFAGYSDIAIGLCRIFGFSLKENFRYPYISTSVSEFWRRWHISLGTWFREYVYIPLGGSRKGNVCLHLFIVFLLTGIWHGAEWSFVLWGIVNGIFVVLERLIRDHAWYQKIPAIIKWLCTILIIFFNWILFMSTDTGSAWKIYKALLGRGNALAPDFTWQYFLSGRIVILLAIAVLGSFIGTLPFIQKWKEREGKALFLIRKVILLAIFALAILFVVNSTYSPFMYFQF